MPDDISYPYRPSPIYLPLGAFGIAIPVFGGWVLVSALGGKLSAETWGALALFGLLEALMTSLLFPLVIATYFYWVRRTKITLRRSDIILPVGLTQQETAIRHADIGYAEKVLGGRASNWLSIMVRGGPEIKIFETWLPTTDIASLQAELATRRLLSERNSDG